MLSKNNIKFFIIITILLNVALYSKEYKAAFNFSFKDKISKKRTSIKDLGKNNTIMLVFWNVCCSKDILPELNDLYLKYQSKNLVFVAVSLDRGSTISKAKNFLKTINMNAEVHFDKNGDIYRQYHGGFTKPVFILIDKNFKVIFRHDGKASKEFYEKEIQKSLNL